MNQIVQLNKLKELLDNGVINETEFKKLKEELLESSTIDQKKLRGSDLFREQSAVDNKNKTLRRYIFIGVSVVFIILLVTYFLHNNKNDLNDKYPLDKALPQTLLNKIPVTLLNGKSIKLSELPENITDTSILKTFYSKFVDLDHDGIREIITGYNNGGNAAIETNELFVLDSHNVYKEILKYDGDLNFGINKIDFNFNCHTKYFYTCGACSIWLPEDYVQYSIFSLGYKSNILYYLMDNSLNEKIKKNLDYLKRKGNFTTDASGDDIGTRKAYMENLVEFFFNNNGDLELTKNTFFEYYPNSDSNIIWEEIKKQILGFKNNFNIQVSRQSKNLENRVTPSSPVDIFNEFRKSLSKGDFESAQQYIYSKGVYFFGNGRISKVGFNKNKINSLKGGFELHMVDPGDKIPEDNTSGKEMIDYIIKDGQIEINDNYNNAAGFDVIMESPHFSDNWRSDGGYFKKGSKIVMVNSNPDQNNDRLLVEFYPDNNGSWKIFSIGKWYWTP
jgi:hypothetical protein